jgi:hypothetical protein
MSPIPKRSTSPLIRSRRDSQAFRRRASDQDGSWVGTKTLHIPSLVGSSIRLYPGEQYELNRATLFHASLAFMTATPTSPAKARKLSASARARERADGHDFSWVAAWHVLGAYWALSLGLTWFMPFIVNGLGYSQAAARWLAALLWVAASFAILSTGWASQTLMAAGVPTRMARGVLGSIPLMVGDECGSQSLLWEFRPARWRC